MGPAAAEPPACRGGPAARHPGAPDPTGCPNLRPVGCGTEVEDVTRPEVKVVCSRGHREALIGRIGHRAEDLRPSIGPEDFAPESGARMTVEEVEALTLHAGATVGHGRGASREDRPGGGTKSRLRCPVPTCRLDVPVSWETLNGS